MSLVEVLGVLFSPRGPLRVLVVLVFLVPPEVCLFGLVVVDLGLF